MKRRIAVLVCLLALAVSAMATDLVNKDSKQYRIEIRPNSGTRKEMDVKANSTYSNNELKKGYVVINLTTGEKITVTTDKRVLIVSGKFKQE